MKTKVTRRAIEQESRELEAHRFQYLESEISRAIEREIVKEIMAISPPWEITSIG